MTTELIAGRHLSREATRWAMNTVMSGQASDVELAGFLVAMQAKGASVDELHTLADTMLEHGHSIQAPAGAIDIVGTGGDGAHTVNISTMSSLVIRGAGIPVVKHGNRASTSKSGAADVLEELGVKLDVDLETVERIGHDTGLTFCFAQAFHPSMKHVATARRVLKVPTVFNVLGPLTNPGRVRACAIGVAFEELAPVIAGVFAQRNSSALVFRGRDGLDEISIAAPSDVWEVRDGEVASHVIAPEDFGFESAPVSTLRGGDPAFNANVVRELLDGARGPIRDAVVMNSAAGIVAAQALDNAREAQEVPLRERLSRAARLAEESLDSGRAKSALEGWVRATQGLPSTR